MNTLLITLEFTRSLFNSPEISLFSLKMFYFAIRLPPTIAASVACYNRSQILFPISPKVLQKAYQLHDGEELLLRPEVGVALLRYLNRKPLFVAFHVKSRNDFLTDIDSIIVIIITLIQPDLERHSFEPLIKFVCYNISKELGRIFRGQSKLQSLNYSRVQPMFETLKNCKSGLVI